MQCCLSAPYVLRTHSKLFFIARVVSEVLRRDAIDKDQPEVECHLVEQ